MGAPQPGSVTIRVALVAGGLLVAITEGLGALRLLAPLPVVLAWLTAGAAVWGTRTRWLGPAAAPGGDTTAWRETRGWWAVITMCLALTLLAGLFGAPNAWDGLTYHLPRVERWVEQRHLGFWPTAIDRQLWMSPLGGYAILQFRLLTGSDRLAFLPSWLAYLGCILVSARVARQLGGTPRQAALGALVMATMPVAVLHASSVQTDLMVALWVLCAASLALEAWGRAAAVPDPRLAGWLALAVALAIATKGTAWLALLPWLLLHAVTIVRAGSLRAVVRPALVGVLAILALNAPHLARNVAVFGDPLGDPVARGFLRLSPWTPGGALANLLANLSLHLGTSWTAWNDWWTAALLGVQQRVLGADPAGLFPYFGGFRVQAFSTHESVAGNPLHLLLGLLLVGGLVAWWKRGDRAALRWWLCAGLTAFLLHAVTIRWQPYGARLQLAALAWLAPAVALLWRSRGAQLATAAGLLAVAAPALVGNTLRPLRGDRSVFAVPRVQQYFAERPALEAPVRRVGEDLARAGCSTLDLMAGYDAPEYLLRVRGPGTDPRPPLRHLAPWSPSAVLASPRPPGDSCAVLLFDAPEPAIRAASLDGMTLAWVEDPLALFARATPGPSPTDQR